MDETPVPAPPVILHPTGPEVHRADRRLPARGAEDLDRREVPVGPGSGASLWTVLRECVEGQRRDLVVNLTHAGPVLPPEVISALARARERPWEGGRLQVCGVLRDHGPGLELHGLERGLGFHASEGEAARAALGRYRARLRRAERLRSVRVRVHEVPLGPDADPGTLIEEIEPWDPEREAAMVVPTGPGLESLAACVQALAGKGIDAVVVDLERRKAICGPDVRILREVRAEVRDRGGFLRVVGSGPGILSSVSALGLVRDLSLLPTRRAGVDAFREHVLRTGDAKGPEGEVPRPASGDLEVIHLLPREVILGRPGYAGTPPSRPTGRLHVRTASWADLGEEGVPLPEDGTEPLVLELLEPSLDEEEAAGEVRDRLGPVVDRPGPVALVVGDRGTATLLRMVGRAALERPPLVVPDLRAGLRAVARRLPSGGGKGSLRLEIVRED